MSYHFRKNIVSLSLLFLIILFSWSNYIYSNSEIQEEKLERLFEWAIMDFQIGKYREVIKSLESLLSYFDEQINYKAEELSDKKNLRGKINLLLGASYEMMGRNKKARSNYEEALKIFENKNIEIEGIDLGNFALYRRVFNRTPISKNSIVSGVIEKPVKKKKKRILGTVLIVASAVAALGVLAAVVFKKKKEVEQDLDTDVLNISWIQIYENQSFQMGDSFGEGEPDEQPVHEVFLNTYYISKHEISFGQYDYFCEDTNRQKPADYGWGRGNLPVINVSWNDATAFCIWLSEKTERNIHLPTEAQWEKAAKGMELRRYPWGDSSPDCSIVNYNCYNQTKAVDMYSTGSSYYHCFNMAGNVSEWCRDIYDADYYSNSPINNPFNSPQSDYNRDFVIRGGSWDANQNLTIRCADRGYAYSSTQSNKIGFRIVKEEFEF